VDSIVLRVNWISIPPSPRVLEPGVRLFSLEPGIRLFTLIQFHFRVIMGTRCTRIPFPIPKTLI
jgi:hypothetical protein